VSDCVGGECCGHACAVRAPNSANVCHCMSETRYHGTPMTGRAPSESVGRTLVTEAQINQRVKELGAQLTADYAGTKPLLVAVLRGAYMFMADLSRESAF